MTAALNHQRQTRSAWIMLSPALILMMVILILPILIAFGLSFTDYGLGVKSVDFVGLENYERIFTRSTFKKMFTATVLYVIVVVPFSDFLCCCSFSRCLPSMEKEFQRKWM